MDQDKTYEAAVPHEGYVGLVVRKLAGDDGIARVKLYDRYTGLAFVARADTEEPCPWPVERIHFSNIDGEELVDPPEKVVILHGYQVNQPWVELIDVNVVHKPAGTEANPWGTAHTFLQCARIKLHMGDRDVTYRVVRQPDKYDSGGNPTDAVADPTARVDWFYLCKLERVQEL